MRKLAEQRQLLEGADALKQTPAKLKLVNQVHKMVLNVDRLSIGIQCTLRYS